MKFQHLEEWVEFWKTSVQPEIRRNDEPLEWVKNGTVDLRGRPALRTKSGGWKASLFIIVVAICESLTYVAIASNLIIYLTTVLHEGVATSVKNVNYWVGVSCVTPLVGGFIADAYCGRYWTVLVSSIVYLSGLVLLTLSVSLSTLKPPDQCESGICSKATTTQIGVFFMALYLICLGTGGNKPSLEAFGADQFDEEDKSETLQKNSFFNFWHFGVSCGIILAVTVVSYVEENISWGFGFGILTVAMGMATVVFFSGTPFYRHKLPAGSPITRIAQVVVGAIRKRNCSMPLDMNLLYENRDLESIKSGQTLLLHTNNFHGYSSFYLTSRKPFCVHQRLFFVSSYQPFLDKAAIMAEDSSVGHTNTQGNAKPNPWKVCTVTQVEETKLLLRMVPIWFSCLIFGMVAITQTTSLFIKQGSTMDRNIGSHFRVPQASLVAFSPLCGLVFVTIYDRCIVPLARRITGNERGITVLQRIGIGMFFSVLSMVTAALTEMKRIHVAKTHGLLDSPRITIPLSVFWLTPQFVIMGIAEVFTLIGLQEYFYDQVPDSMRSLGIAFYLSILGVASFLGSVVITIVEKVSKGGGHQGWLGNNLNRSKLDYFYGLLAILSAINLCGYACIARIYTYKKMKQRSACFISEADIVHGDIHDT